MSQTIKQSVTFNAKPGVIFEALMDSRKHSAFTGAPANLSRDAGGRFTCYGGQIGGYNIEIKANKSIVQAWRAKDWPQGIWSLVTYSLAPARGGKTKLSFEHAGVPAGKVKGITAGWKNFYWQPLKKMVKDAAAAERKSAKAAKPAARKTAKPAARKTAKATVRKTAKPAARKTARPAARKTAKPASTRRTAVRKTGAAAGRRRAPASRRGK